jgi:hypothetical protein
MQFSLGKRESSLVTKETETRERREVKKSAMRCNAVRCQR